MKSLNIISVVCSISLCFAYQECKVIYKPVFGIVCQEILNVESPKFQYFEKRTSKKHQLTHFKQNMPSMKLKLDIAKSDIPVHIPTESEIRIKQQIAELDKWFHERFPALFPKHIDCQTLSWDECVWQNGCSWCKWPYEGCQYTDVSYLLPTIERCIDGGVPVEPDYLPNCLMNIDSYPLQWIACRDEESV